ncbi:hypothetical protein FK535_17535 [Mycolicibacterium sp. 018/SC-01/001]|uniref:Swt1 family HEPN domain-containing protein n=1 Tax=Mycolicibacterium sp. 018/SC-01/001 TaxID=2592069 RepID=UPI00117D616B|nr:Swt1 family HEPN domain-containing protein [Mycolicibacterium sp. 018/SC-01/001]TRW81256.1 hypothetical protein FK535_17535 [Mycolicibacterium sp. 018/SC-01/001]
MAHEADNWLDPESELALRSTVPEVMGGRSLALYARWWQLETWLRDLIYVEFRAAFGVQWSTHVDSTYRQSQDANQLRHMHSPDVDNPLAYLDSKKLLDLIATHWFKFQDSLIDLNAWNGRQDELQKIRHRIMHLRKPHSDDLRRIEQTLRDLERGAFTALAAYTRRYTPARDGHSDPVTDAWIHRKHPRAYLIQHAETQYEANITFEVSKRPWLPEVPPELDRAPGILWHFGLMFRNRTINPRRIWLEVDDPTFRTMLVHLSIYDPYHIEFTFSAADDGRDIVNAIRYAFEASLASSRRVHDVKEVDYEGVSRAARDLDFRVLSESRWNIVSDSTIPISIFGSGGSVISSP